MGAGAGPLRKSDGTTLPAGMLRGAWYSLPALALGSAFWCLGASLVVLVSPGVTPLAVVVAALLVGPSSAAMASVVNRIVFDELATVRPWLRALPRTAAFGIGQHLAVAVPAALFLVALRVWHQTGAVWVLASVGVSGAAAALGVVGLPTVLLLRTARAPHRTLTLWGTSLALAAAHPLRFAAAPVLAGFGIWVGTAWTASALLLVPAPVLLVAGAAVWSTLDPTGWGTGHPEQQTSRRRNDHGM